MDFVIWITVCCQADSVCMFVFFKLYTVGKSGVLRFCRDFLQNPTAHLDKNALVKHHTGRVWWMLYSDFKTKMIRRTTSQKSVGEVQCLALDLVLLQGKQQKSLCLFVHHLTQQGGYLCKNSEGRLSLNLRCCLLPYNWHNKAVARLRDGGVG